eukprot:scaffold26215_cov107-Isochrysis_galbana.AAC.3
MSAVHMNSQFSLLNRTHWSIRVFWAYRWSRWQCGPCPAHMTHTHCDTWTCIDAWDGPRVHAHTRTQSKERLTGKPQAPSPATMGSLADGRADTAVCLRVACAR